MSKRAVLQQTRNKTRAIVVGSVLGAMTLANVVPFPYYTTTKCTHGSGTYVTAGRFMGLPLPYFNTAHSVKNDCQSFDDASPSGGFSAQALGLDGLVFGLVTMGVNLLVDRRTMA